MTEIPERTDFELIDALSRAVLNYAAALYKKGEIVWDDVKFENAWEDRSTAWADLEQRFEDLRALQDERDGGWQDIDKLAARIVLEQTCGACPEQYDAKLDGALVGYLRLRHGAFRVDYPECGGETVFSAHPKGDGIFEEDEREGYLIAAKRAIAQAILPRPPHSKDSEG